MENLQGRARSGSQKSTRGEAEPTGGAFPAHSVTAAALPNQSITINGTDFQPYQVLSLHRFEILKAFYYVFVAKTEEVDALANKVAYLEQENRAKEAKGQEYQRVIASLRDKESADVEEFKMGTTQAVHLQTEKLQSYVRRLHEAQQKITELNSVNNLQDVQITQLQMEKGQLELDSTRLRFDLQALRDELQREARQQVALQLELEERNALLLKRNETIAALRNHIADLLSEQDRLSKLLERERRERSQSCAQIRELTQLLPSIMGRSSSSSSLRGFEQTSNCERLTERALQAAISDSEPSHEHIRLPRSLVSELGSFVEDDMSDDMSRGCDVEFARVFENLQTVVQSTATEMSQLRATLHSFEEREVLQQGTEKELRMTVSVLQDKLHASQTAERQATANFIKHCDSADLKALADEEQNGRASLEQREGATRAWLRDLAERHRSAVVSKTHQELASSRSTFALSAQSCAVEGILRIDLSQWTLVESTTRAGIEAFEASSRNALISCLSMCQLFKDEEINRMHIVSHEGHHRGSWFQLHPSVPAFAPLQTKHTHAPSTPLELCLWQVTVEISDRMECASPPSTLLGGRSRPLLDTTTMSAAETTARESILASQSLCWYRLSRASSLWRLLALEANARSAIQNEELARRNLFQSCLSEIKSAQPIATLCSTAQSFFAFSASHFESPTVHCDTETLARSALCCTETTERHHVFKSALVALEGGKRKLITASAESDAKFILKHSQLVTDQFSQRALLVAEEGLGRELNQAIFSLTGGYVSLCTGAEEQQRIHLARERELELHILQMQALLQSSVAELNHEESSARSGCIFEEDCQRQLLSQLAAAGERHKATEKYTRSVERGSLLSAEETARQEVAVYELQRRNDLLRSAALSYRTSSDLAQLIKEETDLRNELANEAQSIFNDLYSRTSTGVAHKSTALREKKSVTDTEKLCRTAIIDSEENQRTCICQLFDAAHIAMGCYVQVIQNLVQEESYLRQGIATQAEDAFQALGKDIGSHLLCISRNYCEQTALFALEAEGRTSISSQSAEKFEGIARIAELELGVKNRWRRFFQQNQRSLSREERVARQKLEEEAESVFVSISVAASQWRENYAIVSRRAFLQLADAETLARKLRAEEEMATWELLRGLRMSEWAWLRRSLRQNQQQLSWLLDEETAARTALLYEEAEARDAAVMLVDSDLKWCNRFAEELTRQLTALASNESEERLQLTTDESGFRLQLYAEAWGNKLSRFFESEINQRDLVCTEWREWLDDARATETRERRKVAQRSEMLFALEQEEVEVRARLEEEHIHDLQRLRKKLKQGLQVREQLAQQKLERSKKPWLCPFFGLEVAEGIRFDESVDIGGTRTRDVEYCGLRIASVTGPAALAGLVVGDVIEEFEGRIVRNLQEFRDEVLKVKPGARVLIVVRRGLERVPALLQTQCKFGEDWQPGHRRSEKVVLSSTQLLPRWQTGTASSTNPPDLATRQLRATPPNAAAGCKLRSISAVPEIPQPALLISPPSTKAQVHTRSAPGPRSVSPQEQATRSRGSGGKNGGMEKQSSQPRQSITPKRPSGESAPVPCLIIPQSVGRIPPPVAPSVALAGSYLKTPARPKKSDKPCDAQYSVQKLATTAMPPVVPRLQEMQPEDLMEQLQSEIDQLNLQIERLTDVVFLDDAMKNINSPQSPQSPVALSIGSETPRYL
eukprot:TRINITY_DN9050_c0_g1_i1.p1 TRINITY_DN9050_c0_g1~~TRINITY_DN9050_c0_g1_i1.p1  ORF type:complete len:1705 (-),score=264.53 TRINITY_DN9050_c0_g1_i1:15-5105(-)